MPPAESSPADQVSARTPIWVLVVKWTLILATIAGSGYLIQRLIDQGMGAGIVVVAMVAMAVLAVYSTRRSVPMKYLLPGLVLLLGLQVWPMVMTVATAFTNYGDGHKISKQAAIDSIVATSVQEVEGAPRYQLSVAVKEGSPVATGDPYYLLTKPDGSTYVGSIDGLTELKDGVEKNDSGRITKAAGYTILNAIQVNARRDLKDFAVKTHDGGGIKAVGLSEAYEGRATVTYDKETDTLYNSVTKQRYVVKDGYFVAEDGSGNYPTGWTENVGWKNFQYVLTDPTFRAGFVKIFIWNVAFAAISVLSTFFLGMLLALLFNDERLKGKGFYRSLLVLPYAIPGFITALLWASMFNQDYGLVNSITHLNIDWLGDPWAAKAAILIANLWLGFPYMFLITTGALQSIPGDVKEAAKIDGASPLRTLRSIIMPLLLVAVGPLLISSFAFNFNNFSLIYLLTGGGPFEAENTTIGSTDLLITFAYRIAVSGVSPNFGLASTISIFIFAIVAVMSYSGFKRSKQLEEIN